MENPLCHWVFRGDTCFRKKEGEVCQQCKQHDCENESYTMRRGVEIHTSQDVETAQIKSEFCIR